MKTLFTFPTSTVSASKRCTFAFTLIELLILVLILTVCAAILMPTMFM